MIICSLARSRRYRILVRQSYRPARLSFHLCPLLPSAVGSLPQLTRPFSLRSYHVDFQMLLLRVIGRNESVRPQYGDAYTCLLILDTNVARFDIFKGESRVSETELDVEISTDVCKCGTVTSKEPACFDYSPNC
jgi:hypothetical protein